MSTDTKNIRPSREQSSESTAKRWAVLVGITQYRQVGQPDLKYCVNDVQKLDEILSNYAGYSEVEIFENSRATKNRIEEQIRLFARVAPPDALLLFHFSGHGMVEGARSYLIAYDTSPPLSENGIDILAIKKELAEDYNRRNVVFVLDCCREPVGKPAMEKLAKGFILPREDIPDGMAILYSCQEGGIAWEMSDKPHGAFTYHFMKALRGDYAESSQQFTLQEVYDQTQREVETWSQRLGHNPIQKPDWEIKGDIHRLAIATPPPVDRREFARRVQEGLRYYDADDFLRSYEKWQWVQKHAPDYPIDAAKFKEAEDKYNQEQKRQEEIRRHLEYAQIALEGESYPEAYRLLDVILGDNGIDPDNLEARNLRNEIQRQEKLSKLRSKLAETTDYVKIVKISKQVLDLEPDDKDAQAAYEEAQRQLNIAKYRKEAQEAFDEAEYENAVESWGKLLELDTEDEEAKAGLKEAKKRKYIQNEKARAISATEQEDYQTAFDAWNCVLEVAPDYAEAQEGVNEAQRQLDIQKYRQQAKDAFAKRDYNDAIALWNKLLELDSDDREAKEGVTKIQRLTKLHECLQKLEKAVIEDKHKEAVQKWEAIRPFLSKNVQSKYDKRIDSLVKEIEQRDRDIKKLNAKNVTIQKLESELQERDHTISGLQSKIEKAKKRLTERQAEEERKKSRKRFRVAAGFIGFIVLFAIGAVIWFAYQRQAIVGKDGPEMVLIPAGEFEMGDHFNEGDDDEKPVHKVYTDAFYMDKYEVTNEQYAKFLNEYGKNEDSDGHELIDLDDEDCLVERSGSSYRPKSGYANHPVVKVSWYGANAYAEYYGKRLPTEAEWEKAARGGLVGKRYPWGDEDPDAGGTYRANYGPGDNDADGYQYTAPVGSYTPNGYGLYDMAGNVWEWCADWYDSDYYSSSPLENPTGPASGGSSRFLRGGSWYSSTDYIRVAYRSHFGPSDTDSDLGFRCCVSQDFTP